MSFYILLIVSAFGFGAKNSTEKEALPPINKYPRMEILLYKQFKVDAKKFELSGIAKQDDKVLVVSDKNDPNIYELNWDSSVITTARKLDTKDSLDSEAIDVCGDIIYVSNEKNNDIYQLTADNKTIEVQPDYKKYKINRTLFDVNVFYEGIAVDCKNQIMYMTKEREERHILTYDLKTKKITDKWNIPETDSWDFADAKFEDGFLYVLERGNHLVTKINVSTKEVVTKYSYQNFEKGSGFLFGPALFAQGEALLLTKDEVWIGFDGNGRKATSAAEKEFNLKGAGPLVVRFKRPKGF